MNDDPFLVSKNGNVWACWLNGKPAVNLGSEQNFWVVAEKLFSDLHPVEQAPPENAVGREPLNKVADGSNSESANRVDRDEPRFEVTLIGRLYGSGGSREVTIFDLSRRGCRVEDYSSARPGAMVTIKIGSVGPIAAVVRWQRDKFIGLMFENPLYPAVLEDIRQRQSLR